MFDGPLHGCQGMERTPTLQIKKCPQCGNEIEIFSTDANASCDRCGFVIDNDAQSCIQWCAYARLCAGEELYKRFHKEEPPQA